MLNFGERLKSIRKALGYRQSEFASILGVDDVTISRYENDKVEPTKNFFNKLAKLNINLNWLLTGGGEMLNPSRPVQDDRDDECIYVPLLGNIKAVAVVDDKNTSDFMPFRKSWLKRHNIVVNSLSTTYITGDVMNPTLIAGDLLLVDCSQTIPILDSILVVRADFGVVVKRCGGVSGSKLILKSDNPVISDVTIDLEHDNASVVGRVVWFGRII